MVILAMSTPPSLAQEAKIGFSLRKIHVHVVNGLSGQQSLFLHCKSRDDDLGTHNLGVGDEYSWSFRVNFLATTLFWCYMRTSNGLHAEFDVFWPSKGDWLSYRCNWKNCIWTAKDDGIYLRNIPENYDELLHKWESVLIN
ncbi:hypothetical protein I3843_04G099900 [Carya illinoinensis]|uniref:S-protein homolog n=2 Tax=Carya illinoinensis TaxID=32201 RepID=A0A8T1QRX9_CARIL|nr:hypothetical protein I3760_04G107600 [Carya illinoinensis]KAG6657690.1 hypothetical protein CIPAW_04G108000 [Carya illinoinensis]KAG6717559.1 hypothetical protein I3842_04G107000 [Carya illinoinensis]KAG7983313.1 hypothetical protein I3843_04G099900 [Carya illinoinensis]